MMAQRPLLSSNHNIPPHYHPNLHIALLLARKDDAMGWMLPLPVKTLQI